MTSQLNLFHLPLEHNLNENLYNTEIVYCELDKPFLDYIKKYNYKIQGSNEGERCYICIYKWIEAYHAGVAPKVLPESTSIKVLEYVPIELIKNYF